MASGHVNRIQRPNTWLHRPICKRDQSSCQPGAVHTWPEASVRCDKAIRPESRVKPTCRGHSSISAIDPSATLRRGRAHRIFHGYQPAASIRRGLMQSTDL